MMGFQRDCVPLAESRGSASGRIPKGSALWAGSGGSPIVKGEIAMLHTKQDYQAFMHTLLDPLKPLYSTGGARLRIGGAGVTYHIDAIELEAFSRPLWALVPFWMGGGHDEEWENIYRRGLANGTDPKHPEYWGGFSDYDQRFVEMAAIACGLLFAPDILWTPQPARAKENIARWLNAINEYIIPDCNWQFFRVLVNLALKKHGMPYSPEKLAESLEKAESYYVGGGWYRDGASSQKDYYIPFAMQYYGLVYARAMDAEDPARAQTYRARAAEFAKDFLYWFDENGAALPYGRSLTYRFGQAAFWPACLFAGVETYPLSVVKGILSRHFDYWMRQDMFDRDGILTVGYAYPNLIMAERYNAPGSPYWGMKSFIVLALPDDHPFWTAEAAPLPPMEPLHAIPHADMIVQRRAGDVIAYPAGVCERYGHGHVPEKYGKFAYSTRFGFSCARSQIVLHENCPDSMLAFVIDGSDYVFVREASETWEVRADSVVSTWSPFPGIRVRTQITPTATGHTRRHEIESDYACTAYDCGFAVEKFTPDFAQSADAHSAAVRGGGCTCTVRGGEGCFVGADPNTNVLYRNTEIPAVKYRVEKGKTVLETRVETQTEEGERG